MKKILFLMLTVTTAMAQTPEIRVYYKSCDTVRLTMTPSAPPYLWTNGATTQTLLMAQTDTNMFISCTSVAGTCTIKEPILPALPVSINAQYYTTGTSWVLVDWDYFGQWKIEYLRGKVLLNATYPTWLQWGIYQPGTYYIRETRGKCVRKSNPVIIQ